MAIATITSTISSLNAAKDIVKALMTARDSLVESEYMLKIHSVAGMLSDARDALYEAKDEIREKDERIRELESILAKKNALPYAVKFGKAAYLINGSGAGCGVPYCANCYENKSKLVDLNLVLNRVWQCSSCSISIPKIDVRANLTEAEFLEVSEKTPHLIRYLDH
ncbi:hypothetical protein [Enterovibrio norvegicus]|uniref:hypothetical protein n=1 Tax=Enterovibrio norvegicus TaxID=188144 RepID=UPI00352D7AB0